MNRDDRPMSGVHIGRDNLGAAAAGKGARATQYVGAEHHDPRLAAVLAAFADLDAKIEAAPGAVEDVDAAVAAVRLAEDAVTAKAPDAEAANNALDRLMRLIRPVGAAAGVAAAVYQVKQLVDDLLSMS
jgi:hypothetical protein